MEENLIKLFDLNKAEQLRLLGFEYMLENIGGTTAYVFCVSEELKNQLNSKFDKDDFFLDNTLRF